jgi:hypothetical protein
MGRVAVAIDIAAVLLFVGIGRAVHADAASLPGFASTAWPFASGLALGWLALLALKLPVEALVSGLVVALSTVVFGMTLRVVSGQGTALAFILVAVAFLGAEMLGWRLFAGVLRPSRSASGQPEDR